MAAISCIISSILGWLVAGIALLTGEPLSTAFLLFMLTSLTLPTALVVKAATCNPNPQSG